MTPAPTRTPRPTVTPKPTAKPTAKPTVKPTVKPTARPTATPTRTPRPTITSVPTRTPAPTRTPYPTPTAASPQPPTSVLRYLDGVMVYAEPVELSSAARVTVTLLEEGPAGSRVVPTTLFVHEGQQPVEFIVRFVAAEIDPALPYRLLASVADGPNAWIADEGLPVLTGGWPSSGVVVPLTYRPDLVLGEVSGSFSGVPVDLSLDARWEAFLVRSATGDVVAYAAGWVDDPALIAFAVPFDPAEIDPTVAHVVVGRVVDGDAVWTGPGAPAVTLGAPFANIVLPVAPRPGGVPEMLGAAGLAPSPAPG